MTPEDGETCVRMVCNSCLNPLDVQTAQAAKWEMHREWCASLPAEIGAPMKARLQRLYDFLSSGLLKVKVLPDEAFGLIHGKAGVITRTDGSQVCFIGSANESRTTWVSNYELVWLDESEEGVRWVQEEFCAILARRPGLNSGFMKTMLLRRVGSTIEAGRLTAMKMLGTQPQGDQADEEGENEEEEKLSSLYPLSHEERAVLGRFLKILEENRDEDPKLRQVERILTANDITAGGWLSLGCIIFSQYYDSVLWLGLHLSKRMPDEKIGVYANATKSGIIENGIFRRVNRDEVKKSITAGELHLVIGTDAASEGLKILTSRKRTCQNDREI